MGGANVMSFQLGTAAARLAWSLHGKAAPRTLNRALYIAHVRPRATGCVSKRVLRRVILTGRVGMPCRFVRPSFVVPDIHTWKKSLDVISHDMKFHVKHKKQTLYTIIDKNNWQVE